MTERDKLHARAAVVAQALADKLARLEPESSLLSDVSQLRALLVELIETESASEVLS